MRGLIDPSLSVEENKRRLQSAAALKRKQLELREAQLMAELSLQEQGETNNNNDMDNTESQYNNDKTTSRFTAGKDP